MIADSRNERDPAKGGYDEFQSEAPLAMCLVALRNIAGILRIEPLPEYRDRLSPNRVVAVGDKLCEWRLPAGGADFERRRSATRRDYEPLLAAMADYFVIQLP